MSKKIAILISNASKGSNLKSIAKAIEEKRLDAKIIKVISGAADAEGFIFAKAHDIPSVLLPRSNLADKILTSLNPDYIVLAGWKRIIPDNLIDAFPSRILNIHPGLIPDSIDGFVNNPDGTKALWNKGKMTENAIKSFMEAKSTYAGSSVHFLTNEFDFGPVVGRCYEKINSNDSVDRLYKRLKKKENKLYVNSLIKLCNNNIVKKRILIIGSGAREHAIGWRLGKSPHVGKIYFAPGNGGTEKIGENIDIQADKPKKLLSWAKNNKIDLVVVGPETSLEKGIVDIFQKNNIDIFGPIRKAAKLEYSKAWAVECMQKYSIPHPKSHIFSNAKKAIDFVSSSGWNGWVIKADGLAAGKGVLICKSAKEAKKAVEDILVKKIFGRSGKRIVIQEMLIGKEMSLLAFCDGKSAVALLPAQDHKRVFDNDLGPNTGGMGAFAPMQNMSKASLEQIRKNVLQKMVDGLRSDGIEFKGVLYAGIMMTSSGPKVLEYNTRFGDPETQPLMMLLRSDLYKIICACIGGTLNKKDVISRPGFSVCVVLASKGYPGKFQIGKKIGGLEKLRSENVTIFHAGTVQKGGKVATNGGRVLSICAYGKDIKSARKSAYGVIGKRGVWFANMHYRKDIGKSL